VTGVIYDSGALIAAERSERRMWARHRALLLRRVVPTVPAPVIAQCWRGPLVTRPTQHEMLFLA
jgi:hypothetical protein